MYARSLVLRVKRCVAQKLQGVQRPKKQFVYQTVYKWYEMNRFSQLRGTPVLSRTLCPWNLTDVFWNKAKLRDQILNSALFHDKSMKQQSWVMQMMDRVISYLDNIVIFLFEKAKC